MLKPMTWIAASIAGLAAFGWTLVTYSAPARPGGSMPTGYSDSPNRWSAQRRLDPQERIRQLRGVLAEHPEDSRSWYQLGQAQRLVGDTEGATASWTKAAETLAAEWPSPPDSTFLYNLACFRALAGDKEGALEAWAACVGSGWDDREHARGDLDLESIRTDPRFVELLRRIPRRTIRVNAG